MNKVHTFAVDKQMRDEVKDYIIDYMKSEVIQKTFNGQDVAGYMEAKNIIERCFSNMDKEFSGDIVKEFINEME